MTLINLLSDPSFTGPSSPVLSSSTSHLTPTQPPFSMDAFSSVQPMLTTLFHSLNQLWSYIEFIPGSNWLLSYIKNSYQNDPVRVMLELLLFFFALKYLLSKKYQPNEPLTIQFTEAEIDDLIDEWVPEPLVPMSSSYTHRMNLPSSSNSSSFTSSSTPLPFTFTSLEEKEKLTYLPSFTSSTIPSSFTWMHDLATSSSSSSSSSSSTFYEPSPIVLTSATSAKVKVMGSTKPMYLASSLNVLGLANHPNIKSKAIEALHTYGVGSCGPPGFYGTMDVHMQLEQLLAQVLGFEQAILYAQAFSTISSVIPAFAKRGDLILVDEGIHFPAQKGVQISRSNVIYFKHNDLNDLELKLKALQELMESPTDSSFSSSFSWLSYPFTWFKKPSNKKNASTSKPTTPSPSSPSSSSSSSVLPPSMKKKKKVFRKFILVEGVSANYGDIVNLPGLIELKKKYKYRLMLDDSMALGCIGSKLLGSLDYHAIQAKEIDIYMGSLAGPLACSGGFCAGSKAVIEHQRLSAAAYVFSASLPPLLTVACMEGLNLLKLHGKEWASLLQKNIHQFRAGLQSVFPGSLEWSAPVDSPIQHLRINLDTLIPTVNGSSTITSTSSMSLSPSDPSSFPLPISSSSSSCTQFPSSSMSSLVPPLPPTSFSPSSSSSSNSIPSTCMPSSWIEETHFLQAIVEEAFHQNVVLSRAKYNVAQEYQCPRPSIKCILSIEYTKKDIDVLIKVMKQSILKVAHQWSKKKT